MKTIGQRLKHFGSSLFKTKKEFAEALSTSYENLYQYMEDKSKPGPDLLTRLNDLNCNINWLLTGKGEIFNKTIEYSTEEEKLPFYKIMGTVPAGKADAHFIDEWNEMDNLFYDPKDHFFLNIDEDYGYSMMPAINPGDRVLVSLKSKVKDGDLVVAKWDATKGALKLLSTNPDDPNSLVLTSYNQSIKPIFITKKKASVYKVVLIQKRM